ncbi:MAG: glycosyltransferase family 2 protein [Terriglobia bacterium]
MSSELVLKVSVAMCTYNGEAFIEQQLDSIARQTRPPDELIISDDGSSDRTMEIAQRVAAGCKFPVRIFRNARNLGHIKNFENAIAATTGDIILMSDFDDVWFPERVSMTIPYFLESSCPTLVYCDAQITDEVLRPVGASLFKRRQSMQLGVRPTADQIGRGLGFNAPMIAFHRDLKPFILPFSNQWAHDHWIGFIAHAVGEVNWIDQPLLYYRRYGQNVGGDPDLDGGLLHRWRVAAKKSELNQYAHRIRRFDHMLKRLQEIKSSGTPLPPHNRLDELIKECGDCLRFARVRENMKKRPRIARIPAALLSLTRGDYRRHAHGAKSFAQDVAIP